MSASSPINQSVPNYTQQLQYLMEQVDVSSFRQLSRVSGVSERQLKRLRQGQVSQMRVETLLKLSDILGISVDQLLTLFSAESISPITPPRDRTSPTPDLRASESLDNLQQEYQRLQQQLAEQRQTLLQEFQQSSVQVLESWLLQWPTAAYAITQNDQLPAIRLLPLIKPVEQLLQQWGIEAIASVGDELAYDPQWHQLMSGTVQPGDLVRVRYVGYRQGDKLLYRAKVSPLPNRSYR
ncbi:helix-turn-helix domain-containing protein [Coleofasciculus sp. G2-EDA-02]|uniref:helix-turn-helix domain-containing protein n=1 Tax=Coleofasciculus sp. G2-EDA-02 TaxID=3069529 RepID=UPI0032F25A93